MALILSGTGSIASSSGTLSAGVGSTYGTVIDANGKARAPYVPSFKVHVTNSPSVANAGLIPWNVATYNNGNHYTVSTTGSGSYFTAPVQGTYIFGGMVRHDTNSLYLHLQVYLNGIMNNNNGELPGLTSTNNSVGFCAITFAYARYMYPGDYIQFVVNNATGAAAPINPQTYMYGYLAG